MKIKSGYRTSEFWFTLVSFIFSGLYLMGILKENDQKEELIQIVSHAVESVILISGQVFILAKYIRGRSEVKKLAEEVKTNKLNINTASLDDLIALKGIGPALAEAIIDNRPYSHTKQLIDIKGFGNYLYEKLHKHLTT
jgi:competence protein ComEA